MTRVGVFLAAAAVAMGLSEIFVRIMPLWLSLPMALVIGVVMGHVFGQHAFNQQKKTE